MEKSAQAQQPLFNHSPFVVKVCNKLKSNGYYIFLLYNS